jgi:hypothetical protein
MLDQTTLNPAVKTFYYYFLSNDAAEFNVIDEEYPKRKAFYNIPEFQEFFITSLTQYYDL